MFWGNGKLFGKITIKGVHVLGRKILFIDNKLFISHNYQW